ncbi:hypothetical protein PoB_004740800 [Plakobranchus ocellatus]|uniref:Ig-like domain-containing protein n=1 Tax=Plakobranchus ocellatus TaxID=259542 RepID=A0AAV4BMV7_9GAST|nr:hypothetical protein PoB_004740800 [Plakobranchus ocellatus]
MEKKSKVIALVLFAVAAVYSSSQDITDLEQKVMQLEQKQAHLEDRVRNQEEFAQNVQDAFRAVIADTTTSSESTPIQMTGSPTSPQPILTDFVVTPLDVKREKLDNGYRFTVRYIPHAQNFSIVYVFDSVISPHNHEMYNIYHNLLGVPEGTDGIMRVTFEKGFVPYEEYTHSYVYFMTETERVGIKVYMDAGSADVLETILSFKSFPVTPTRHLVYEYGNNTDILVANYTDWKHFYMEAVVFDLDTREGLIAYDDLYFYHSTVDEYKDGKIISGIVQTENFRLTGYLDLLVVNYIVSNSSAVGAIDVTKRILLHPTNQSGPFPDSFMGFPKSSTTKELEDGTRLRYCNITGGNPCHLMVDILSTGPLQFYCVEMVGNNASMSIPLPVTPPSEQVFDRYLRRYMFTVQNRTARQDLSRVQCVGENNAGASVSQILEIFYFIQPQILLQNSSAIVENGTLKVTCAATGLPLPELSIVVGYTEYYSTYYSIPVNQTSVTSDGTIITGVLAVEFNTERTLTAVRCLSQAADRRENIYEYLASEDRAIPLYGNN